MTDYTISSFDSVQESQSWMHYDDFITFLIAQTLRVVHHYPLKLHNRSNAAKLAATGRAWDYKPSLAIRTKLQAVVGRLHFDC